MRSDVKDDILTFLLLNEKANLTDLSKVISAKKEVIRQTIEEINESFGIEVLILNKECLYLMDDSSPKIYNFFKPGAKKLDPFYSIDMRRSLLIVQMLLTNYYFSLQDAADSIQVSRNTALNDMKHIKSGLADENCKLDYSREKGYSISGDEFSLRRVLIKCIQYLLTIPAGKFIFSEKEWIDIEEVFLMRRRLEKVEERLEITFSDEMLATLPYTILAMIRRIKQFKPDYEFEYDINELKMTKEYGTVSAIFWNYTFLTETDLIYLTLQVLSSNVVDSTFLIENDALLYPVIHEFTVNIEEKLAIRFTDRQRLKEQLETHLRPAIYRNLLNLHIINPMTELFIQEYEHFYKIVEKETKLFDSLMRTTLSKDETVFLAMIVLGNIFKTKEERKKSPFSAAVVCKSGRAVSNLLLEVLKGLFPNITFESAYSKRQFELENPNVDFIFSTIAVKTEKPLFIVSSILTKKEKELLCSQVQSMIDKDDSKKIREVLTVLNEWIPTEKYNEALTKLEQYYRSANDKNKDKPYTNLLTDIKQITLHPLSVAWDDVIDRSFSEMLARESVTEEYVEACRENFIRTYETQVIAKSVLLPHASPEYGVNRMDAQINVFNKGITSPDGENYFIVIALAPDKQNRHVDWLLKVNEALNDETIAGSYLTGMNKTQLFEWIGGCPVNGF